ncbi:uncharacterized protein LOC127277866 [Leptopilina boulardi]|uniref:uncharacterized protein LOC127277866 n=1 Tax=Leptopilina boulardi TaxID=63433 RepID=UPI0021F59296|nr:uncharacterized protein LOC127277866 [Leptopilina boulardi]
MDEILNIPAAVNFDESIAHYEIHAHQPYASSSFNNSDEIRIAVQHQDLCILPSKSSLHIFGKLTKNDGIAVTENVHLSSNAICFLFDEIRYELNGIEIDRCKYVGHTTIMKNLVSLTPPQLNLIENAGFSKITADARISLENGYFDITIPLGMIFGFAEDYKKILMNAKHELILTRARNDTNAIIQTDPLISISFRSWEMYEYPLLPTSSKVLWQIKTSTQLEKPRYVIVGFQTARKDKRKKYASSVDVRLEFESGNNMPAETTAYCLIIHDRVVQYKPISGVVKKLL